MVVEMLQISVTRTGLGDFMSVSGHTMVNRVSLESIKLKEAIFDGHIADKMEGFHGPHCTDPILFLWQVPGLRSP